MTFVRIIRLSKVIDLLAFLVVASDNWLQGASYGHLRVYDSAYYKDRIRRNLDGLLIRL
jgi:hypothetical protein